jgi:hypothetical protein
MSVPRRNGKGLREGSKAASNLSAGMHQGAGFSSSPPECAQTMGQRTRQGGKGSAYTGPKDVAQRMRQGTIKE